MGSAEGKVQVLHTWGNRTLSNAYALYAHNTHLIGMKFEGNTSVFINVDALVHEISDKICNGDIDFCI